MKKNKIVISLPTHKRPYGLQEALESINKIHVPEDLSVSVLVVDNDPQGSAKKTIESLVKKYSFKIDYFIERERGLSAVRNRILKEVHVLKADYLAGIDDDEVVKKDWLVLLWNGLKKYKAHVVGGPVISVLPKKSPQWMHYAEVFDPYAKRETGRIVNETGSGNYLLDLHFIRKHGLKFDERFNLIGGGDSEFFSRCFQKGAKIVWVKEALVTEPVPDSRVKLSWILKRYYRIGYGSVFIQKKKRFPFSSLVKIFLYPVFSLGIIGLCPKKGFKLFFRVFYHIGKLSAYLGRKPYKEYKKTDGK
ncbi:MAG: glycosyltransferase [Alphaproteobacteria bacterium]|nr:glycosyltransferase [Alphaproteobacteria bacterium]